MVDPERVSSPQALATPQAEPLDSVCDPGRVLLTVAIDDDLRFISHRDTMRMLVRALVRARVPIAYTQGFNPRAKLSLLLPRPVGVATEGDPVVVGMAGVVEPQELARRLAEQLPFGGRVVGGLLLPLGCCPVVNAVTSVVQMGPVTDGLADRVSRFLAARSVVVTPIGPDGRARRDVDVRPLVRRLELDGGELIFETVFKEGSTVSPKVLLPALGLSWNELRHQIRRKKVQWQ